VPKEPDIVRFKDLLKKKIMFREISDFYVATSFLGKGASSKVYLIREKNKKTETLAASKCIEKSYLIEDGGYVFITSNYTLQQALFLEIQYMQKLDHPNIIKLHEVFEGESTFYMILEYLQGKSLTEFITRSYSNGISLDKVQLIMKVIQNILILFRKKKANTRGSGVHP
jgi:serine/threonine protein kinase